MPRFKLVFFTPRTSTQTILQHLFEKHPQEVGKIGHYEHCAFIIPGTGQFKPGPEANPTIGSRGTLEFVEEDRVEVLVNDKGERAELSAAIKELKAVHPYEEVAYDVYQLEDI
ncbi:hypothetical protein SERLA73DRAFT_133500 [Serpula lacrymans var. lacrymans S7.3]|uniref:ATP phosphoribosyltransferase n=2 Tax=Serpula lacrymans var. lacrymans TaxID=341189 RepID=F8PRF2_SERL3|nr:uncharacterized protein SERLADRAFT_384388 [Serpula lacrymans var. lacrymans S7.9]EGO00575.1 hypothetical protein SERLA73DRAFT_133500 [Serpula lacrymans var. lacrymans S7.3]EGO26130.1 hypothetical protein SERLADRAFT_384388 [Serpula lacrymans var. lacrymans S7.9]